MKSNWKTVAGLALALCGASVAGAKGIEGIWRFDIVNSAGTTLGAMTIQKRDTIQRQENAQHEWALLKGRGADGSRASAHSHDADQPRMTGYGGFAMTDQGGHALPIESIDIDGNVMRMVVNSPRGLVIFSGTIDPEQTRFEGKVTYHNGSIFGMRGVKLVQPL